MQETVWLCDFASVLETPLLGSKNELINPIWGILLVLGGVVQVAVLGTRNVHRTCRERGRELIGTMDVIRWWRNHPLLASYLPWESH